jgi:predicted transcriptional regulator
MPHVPQNANPGKESKPPNVFLTIRLPKNLDRAVEHLAVDMDWTKQQVIEAAVREYLSRNQMEASA